MIEVVLGCSGELKPVYTAGEGADILENGIPVIQIGMHGFSDHKHKLREFAAKIVLDALNKTEVVVKDPTCTNCRFSHTLKKDFSWCICRYNPPARSGESIEVQKDFWCGKYEERAV